jgi:hypothetical protein
MGTGRTIHQRSSASQWTSKSAFAMTLLHLEVTNDHSLTLPINNRFTPGNALSPVGLEWYVPHQKQPDQTTNQRPDLSQPIDGRLLCAVCDDKSNPCLFGGECTSNDECQCLPGSSGALCEQAPLKNGRCDPFLNTALYDYDGGDCCASTCVSNQFTCGMEETAYGYIGYDCRLPTDDWEPRNPSTVLNWQGQFGYSVALSELGNFLAVGAPEISTVRVYEREGNQWTLRGSAIEGEPDSKFGSHVTISCGPYAGWNTPDLKVPCIVGVAAPDENNGTVHVYRCEEAKFGCTVKWRSFDGYAAFDISEDGSTIALGENERDDGGLPEVHLYQINERASLSTILKETIKPIYARPQPRITLTRFVSSISLSRNADTVAIQTGVMDCGAARWNFSDCLAFVTNSVEAPGNKSFVFLQDTISVHADKRSFVVSADSDVAAVAAARCGQPLAQVFQWNGVAWIMRHSLPEIPTEGCAEDFDKISLSLALSGDGASIAIGSPGRVEVYDYNSSHQWHLVGNENQESLFVSLSDTQWVSVALSSKDGTYIAFGVPEARNAEGGTVTIGSTPRRFDLCNSTSEELLQLSLTTDDEPLSLSWTLQNNDTGVISDKVEVGYYRHARATFLHEMCVPIYSCSILTVYESRSSFLFPTKGLEPPGRLDLIVERLNEMKGERERLVVYQGSFPGLMKRISVGSCLACPQSQTMFRMLVTTCEPVGWQLVSNVGMPLFQGRSKAPLQNQTENVTQSGCEQEKYWADVCLNLVAECFTFYAFVFQKQRTNTTERSRVFLFDGDREIWRKQLTEEGQEALSVGNC